MINRYLLHGLGVALSGITTPPPLSPLCSDWLSLSSLILGYCACLRFSCVRFCLSHSGFTLLSIWRANVSTNSHSRTRPLKASNWEVLQGFNGVQATNKRRDNHFVKTELSYSVLWYFLTADIFSISRISRIFSFLCKCLTLAACQQQVEHELTNTVL